MSCPLQQQALPWSLGLPGGDYPLMSMYRLRFEALKSQGCIDTSECANLRLCAVSLIFSEVGWSQCRRPRSAPACNSATRFFLESRELIGIRVPSSSLGPDVCWVVSLRHRPICGSECSVVVLRPLELGRSISQCLRHLVS